MTLSDSERFFLESTTTEDPLTGNGRWRAEDGKTYTAATTLAATLVDKYQVQQWELRHALRGLIERPDIEQLLRATPFDDKRVWGKAVKDCLVMSKKDEKANAGSAFHAYVQAVFEERLEYVDIPAPFALAVAAFFKELARRQLTLVACEQKVVNSTAGSAGRYDFILQHATGWRVIGDAKTGEQVTRSQLEIAQQLAIYNHADDVNADTLRPVRTDIALVLHVSLEHGTCDTLQVDTEAGWQLVMLALRTRAARNRQDLMLPYHEDGNRVDIVTRTAVPAPDSVNLAPPPNPLETAREQSAAAVQQIIAETDAQPLPSAGVEYQYPIGQLTPAEQSIDYQPPPNVEYPFSGMTEVPTHQLSEEHPVAPTAVMSPQGNVVSLAPVAPDPVVIQPVSIEQQTKDEEALMRRYKDKASLQAAAKVVGSDIKLTAYRKNIAAAMVSHPNWGPVRDQLLAVVPALAPNPLSPQAQAIKDNVAKIQEGQVIVPGQPVNAEPAPALPDSAVIPPVGATIAESITLTPGQIANGQTEPSAKQIEGVYLAKIANAQQRTDIAQLWQQAHNEGVEWTALMQSKATERFQLLTS